jgi:hypothetical protein
MAGATSAERTEMWNGTSVWWLTAQERTALSAVADRPAATSPMKPITGTSTTMRPMRTPYSMYMRASRVSGRPAPLSALSEVKTAGQRRP